ncbi:hypothetical protein D9M71_544670 [compost metagenome]
MQQGLRHHRRAAFIAAHVDRLKAGYPTRLLDLAHHLTPGRLIHVSHHYRGPFAGKQQRRRPADAGRPAGHDRNLAL